MLLAAGADPCDGESVYHAADEDHRSALALIEKYVDPKRLAKECTTCLSTQLHWGRSRGAVWLLAHGANPNGLHRSSAIPPFTPPSGNGAALVLQLLLDHGADPKRKNAKGGPRLSW